MISYGVDLDNKIEDGLSVRWIDKKEFCEMEARNYYGEGAGIDSNPYAENSPPYHWFKDEYLKISADDIEITNALTIQKDGVAVNVNFITDDNVYVSRHQSGAVCLPHNCIGLEVYDYADFKLRMAKAMDSGAVVFHAVGLDDLPLPDALVCR